MILRHFDYDLPIIQETVCAYLRSEIERCQDNIRRRVDVVEELFSEGHENYLDDVQENVQAINILKQLLLDFNSPGRPPIDNPLDPQTIAYQFIAAIEGGSTHWCVSILPQSKTDHLTDRLWYADPKFYEKGFRIEIITNDDEPVTKIIDWSKLMMGIVLMQSKSPHHWADLISDNADAITGDVFFQYAAFGEIVYG